VSEEGGDEVCWLARVCDECGAILDTRTPHVCRPAVAPVAGDDDGSSTPES
jgi:hypothetical protein